MRLSVDPRLRAALARLPRTSVYTVAELVLLGVLAAQIARLVWTLATPLGPVGDWRPATQLPAGDPVARLGGFDPFFRTAPDQGSAVLTGLQLTLYGTRIDEATGRGSAILAGPDDVQTSFAVGEEIVPGATLTAVQFDHVVIRRGGVDETLYIDQSGGAAAEVPVPGAGAIGVPSISAVPSVQIDPRGAPPPPGFDSVVREAGLQPRQLPDGRQGLTVGGSGPSVAALGLNAGDVIVEANGQPVRTLDDLRRSAASAGGAVPVVVQRGDQQITLNIGGAR